MKNIALLIFLLLLCSCRTFLERVSLETNESLNIRVKLAGLEEVNIPVKSDLVILDMNSGKNIKLKDKLSISIKDNRVLMNEEPLENPVIVFSNENKLISLNDKKYFGELKISPKAGNFEIINLIPIETYLISVLPSEILIDNFSIEAVKAQAIVARTYAYLFLKKYGDKRDFDVDDSVRYQVYNGYELDLRFRHIIKIKKALKETKGLIITYKDEPILSYFHSNSGGKLLSGKEYFGVNSDFPYLVSKDDPYSVGFPGDKWNYSIAINDFSRLLDTTADVKNENFKLSPDDFVEYFTLNNKTFDVKTFRKLAGYSNIKSERFKVNVKNDSINFNGKGFGHGVGMSQWGAYGMAEKGFNCREIIAFYYPETKIKRY